MKLEYCLIREKYLVCGLVGLHGYEGEVSCLRSGGVAWV